MSELDDFSKANKYLMNSLGFYKSALDKEEAENASLHADLTQALAIISETASALTDSGKLVEAKICTDFIEKIGSRYDK